MIQIENIKDFEALNDSLEKYLVKNCPFSI